MSLKGIRKTEVYPFWNLDDIKKMVDVFTKKKQWHWRLAFNIGLLMGRRVGDTLNLKWNDLFEESGRRKTHLMIIEEKTNKSTFVLIPALVWKEIELYIDKTEIDPSLEKYNLNIFPGTDRKDAAYRTAFKKAAQDVGITYPVSTHSTRKTFGYYGVQLHPYDPANIDVLQKFFNHADRNTTLRYIGLTQHKQDKYSEDFGNMMDDVLAGRKIAIDNCPVITLKTNDLRDILKQAYQYGRDYFDDDPMDAMNKLISMVEEKRVS